LIIAAGRGSRLEQKGLSKPLVPVLGKPIIERVIRSGISAGIKDFYVVTGFNGTRVREFLDDLALHCAIRITHLSNNEWDKGNGLSVLKAAELIKDDFLLMMGDHLVDPDLIKELISKGVSDGEVLLAVDRKLSNPLVNVADATKVKVNGQRVESIGKGLKEFNAFDTGFFLCSPEIFHAIEQSISNGGDSSLSGGINWLAKRGKVRSIEIGDRFWIDVDDPVALKKAEKALLENLHAKQNDGPVSRYLNRPLSTKISRYLAGLPLTANQISFISFSLCLVASALFCIPGYRALVVGGLLTQLASILDGCDGEIARIKFEESEFGAWFDAVLDRYGDAFLLFALTLHACADTARLFVVVVGFMAIIGSFMVSYTADKYDSLMRERIKPAFRIGRDMRLFLIFLGALLNQALAVLVILAVLMNAETIRRIYICRGK